MNPTSSVAIPNGSTPHLTAPCGTAELGRKAAGPTAGRSAHGRPTHPCKRGAAVLHQDRSSDGASYRQMPENRFGCPLVLDGDGRCYGDR